MRIPVVGMDPSLTGWGIAESVLDISTGILDTPKLSLIQPIKDKSKQIRQNSVDLGVSEQLSLGAFKAARHAKAVFVEAPVGSQSARAMASYGICMGILGALKSEGVPLYEVNATEVKLALAGKKDATKREMIDKASEFYPEANFFRQKGHLIDKNEHVADAIGAIHAGINTPMFQSLMKLLEKGE